MTFLKKLGSVLSKGIAVATGIWPLVQGFFGSSTKVQTAVPTVINDLTQIAGIVVQVEAIITAPGSGPDKLRAAAPLVVNIVRTSELVSGKKIANDTLFIQGCTKLTDGVADILNSLHPDAAQTAPGN